MADISKSSKWLLTLLVEFAIQACVNCDPGGIRQTVPATLGEPLTLPCTFNCSMGFVRGQWSQEGKNLGCAGCHWTEKPVIKSGDLCTLPLYTEEVTRNDSHHTYTCESIQIDQPRLPRRTEQQVSLKISTSPKATSSPSVSSMALTSSDGAGDDVDDNSSDVFQLVKVLAVVVAFVIMVLLISYLCFLRRKRGCVAGSEKIPAARHDRPGSDKEYASVTFTNTDCQSDHEVPYADIVISVRGVSTPELRGLPGGAQGNLRAKWREDSGPAPLQHAFRSADRLHVQPREVSRKLSSTSEYAVITYSTDVLH
ncbi:uncharacterized protein LOC134066183 [Sardina pilchardus]|uniref:uncharacterized protein LOC134066183 n=1 Tax=Sardina pilchardus TaxID=27697 RepID=UPI002E0DB6D1